MGGMGVGIFELGGFFLRGAFILWGAYTRETGNITLKPRRGFEREGVY